MLQRTMYAQSCGLSTITNSSYSTQNVHNEHPSVVIIGAGMAGLSAAETLLTNGIKNIKILEATDRYGGRIYTKKWHNGICELGAKCVNFPFDEKIEPIYGDICICSDRCPDFNFYKSDGTLIDSKISNCVRKEFAGLRDSFDDVRLIIDSPTEKIRNMIGNAKKQCSCANEEDVTCVINAVLNSMRCRFGTDLQNVNLDLCKHKIVTNKKIDLPFGCLSFFNLLTAPGIKDLISFGCPVGCIKRMYHFPNRFIRTETLNGISYDSDYVICTIPLPTLSVLGNVMFDPPLSKDKFKSMEKIGVGKVERIFLMFEKSILDWFNGPVNLAWHPNELINRNHWSTGTCTVYKLPFSNNILEVTVAGFQAEDICLASDEKVMTHVHSTLQQFLGINIHINKMCLDKNYPPFLKYLQEILKFPTQSIFCDQSGRKRYVVWVVLCILRKTLLSMI